MALIATVSSLWSSGGELHFQIQRKATNGAIVTPITYINMTAERETRIVESLQIGANTHSALAFSKN